MDSYAIQQQIAALRKQLSREDLEQVDRRLAMDQKSSGLIAGMAAIGFLGVAGIHRFILDDVGMGILMLLTLGGCGIWTIIDLVRATSMAQKYNDQLAFRYLTQAIDYSRTSPGAQPQTF
ncbi:MAG TPA: TM2 domain-containing protein [Thermomicrobiales bacterium]|nr:TM2 domain-containing protein [Thermomicrobiales bacterium]